MNRRSFLAAGIAAAVSSRAATNRLDSSRVSAISDEVSRSPAEAIEFAHTFGMKWLSLRAIPAPLGSKGVEYHTLDPETLRKTAQEFKSAGIGISFLDTPFLKFGLPGTEPARKNPEDPAAREKRIAREKIQFDRRLDDLRLGFRAGHAFDCTQVRIFTFTRVADPESVFPRIADVIGEMAVLAQKEGFRMLIENENTQNAGTTVETAKLLKILPKNVGLNWDSLNGLALGEKPYPDGYNAVPKDRNWNVHVKGKSLLEYPEHQDWPAILDALDRDGFTGRLELETHIFGEGQIAGSHASMRELMRLLSARQHS
jgi:sugar phosphate isomerase/epimerase